MHVTRIPWIVFLCGWVCWIGCEKPISYEQAPPTQVTVAVPVIKTVPIYLEENGQTEAVEEAMVRARVRGIIEKIPEETEESLEVEKGEQLFLIQQDEFIAAVNSAKASVAAAAASLQTAKAKVSVAQAGITTADADLAVATSEFTRLDSLFKQNAIARSELDTASAKLKTANASVDAANAEEMSAKAGVSEAKAALDKANADLAQKELELSWTEVEAPINGRVTRTMVKIGNLVQNGDPLIEIVSADKVWANFNISERFLLNLERESDKNKNEEGERRFKPNTIPVSLKRNGDPDFIFHGFMDYADPVVDQDTGTLLLRAIFENSDPDKFLLPGLFVRVRVEIGTYDDAILIPEKAVNRDSAGAYVYVVNQESKADRKNIVLGGKYDDMIVVESGLEKTDRVVIDGIQMLRPGSEVDATE